MQPLEQRLASTPDLRRKAAFFEDFWKGAGPFPLLVAEPHQSRSMPYLKHDLAAQHADVEKLLQEALLRVGTATAGDGIPVVRADLGTTLFPSALGLPLVVQANQQPWLARHVSLEDYSAGRLGGWQRQGEIPLATSFYERFWDLRDRGAISRDWLPYLPDNQGVLDLTHIILGSDLFYGFSDDPDRVHAAQRQSLALFLEGSRYFKRMMQENDQAMLHGHGMASGVYFPGTGIRISEDSGSLLSETHLCEFCLPYIEQAVRPFGRGFMHFCGKHPAFLRQVIRAPCISSVNLGNPEAYDLEEVFRWCGEHRTVYYGHLDKVAGETDDDYLERLADLCGKTGCRLILVVRHVTDPETGNRLAERWHQLTRRPRGQAG